jgi:hypothetical protein
MRFFESFLTFFWCADIILKKIKLFAMFLFEARRENIHFKFMAAFQPFSGFILKNNQLLTKLTF